MPFTDYITLDKLLIFLKPQFVIYLYDRRTKIIQQTFPTCLLTIQVTDMTVLARAKTGNSISVGGPAANILNTGSASTGDVIART